MSVMPLAKPKVAIQAQQVGLEIENGILRDRLGKLQDFVDQGVPNLVNIINSTERSFAGKQALVDQYNQDWFLNSVYSEDAQITIARALLDVVGETPTLDTSVWKAVVNV